MLSKAISITPDDYELYYKRGIAYENLDDIKPALTNYDKVIQL